MTKSRISGEEIRGEYLRNSNGSICIPDLYHLEVMHTFRLTDDEYDAFLDFCTDEEFDLIVKVGEDFANKRKVVKLLNKFKESYNE